MNVSGKVVIVTGASSGIGEATARLLAEKGASVVLCARSVSKLKSIAKNLPNSLTVPADMTKTNDIKNLVAKTLKNYGRIDVLINNAGRGYDAPVEKIDITKFRQLFELDVVGPIVAMQCVIPTMRKQKSGAIINISSGTALMALPNSGPYSSLKRALAGISLTAHEELAKDNIKVSVIYPYITLTNFEKNTVRSKGEKPWNPLEADLPQPPDSAGFIASKILEAIETGNSEIFAHDWMDPKNHVN